MLIADAAQNALVVRQEGPQNALLRGLRIGGVLHARVIAASAAPDGSGRAILDVRGQQLQARTAQPLTPGESVVLEITDKTPALVLKRLDGPPGRTLPEQGPARERVDSDAARSALARDTVTGSAQTGRPRAPAGYEGDLAKTQYARTDTTGIAQRESMASRVSTQRPLSDIAGNGALDKLLMPLERLFKPDGLAEALRHSGHFLEARLASRSGLNTTDYYLNQDLKSNLLRIQAQAESPSGAQRHRPDVAMQGEASRPAPIAEQGRDSPAVQRAADPRIEHALARIEMNQLMSLGAAHGGTAGALGMLVELPVRFEDEVRDLLMDIGPDERGGGPGEIARRTVRLQIDLPKLGLLVAELQLSPERVDVGFWAEHLSTRQLVSAGWETLAERMRAQGLTVGRLSLLSDKPRVSALDRLPSGLVTLSV